MTSENILSLGFLDRRPWSAARALEEIEPSEAAKFLDHAPPRIAAPVLSIMRPGSAARCLEHMDPGAASALLMAMPHLDAVSVLRLVSNSVLERVLDLSTDRFARRYRRAVAYPRDTVGAWMDVAVPSYKASETVKVTLQSLRKNRHAHSHLFLTDANRQYSGMVAVSELLCHDESALLGDLADRSVEPLSNQAPLVNYAAHRQWDRFSVLPVVGRKKNFLGALSRSELRKGVSEPIEASDHLDHDSMIFRVASAFVTVAGECANLALSEQQQLTSRQAGD